MSYKKFLFTLISGFIALLLFNMDFEVAAQTLPTPTPAPYWACPAGQYGIPGEGCVDADPGHYVPVPNLQEQYACDPGNYQPASGAVSCFPADPGHYVSTTAATGQTACAPGYYQPASGAVSCFPADPGHYVPTTATIEPTACPPGYYQPASGAVSSFPADPGHYVDTTGSAIQTKCAVGTYQPNAGSASCLLADPGYFVDTTGATEQTMCPAGYTSEAGAAACTLANTAPTAVAGGPYLGAVNTSIAFDSSTSSDPEGNPLAYAWDFGNGNSSSDEMPGHSYAEAGIYDVCLTVNDGTLNSESNCTLAVVYDPSAGFVTGGGWIDSPAGAYTADPDLTGKATFGFVAKYKKGANVPDGNTQFQFNAGDLNFRSSSYEWLVVAGKTAQFKGEGTINGQGSYQFMIWAGDDNPDTFRIRIWDGNGTVYDNGSQQTLGGGSIVVHNK